MQVLASSQSLNRPIVGAIWGLTLFALIPFPNLAFVLLGAAANLAANGMALYLLCSRSRVDRANGAARLLLQVAILIVGAVIVARSGVSLDGFLKYFTHRTL